MRTLHLVLPMAGLGSRFQTEKYHLPKPLITVDGQPMFLKAISSFQNIDCPKEYTFIIRQEHVEKFKINQVILRYLPQSNIIITSDPPIGAAVDCLRAKPHVDKLQSLVFLDCDLYFQSKCYSQTITDCLNHDPNDDIAGAILYFQSSDNRYSYAKIENNLVTQTAEKQVISNHAIVGSYFFNSSVKIFDTISSSVSQQLSTGTKEYYLSPLYNKYVDQKLLIKACPVDQYFSFGTPEELRLYEKIHRP